VVLGFCFFLRAERDGRARSYVGAGLCYVVAGACRPYDMLFAMPATALYWRCNAVKIAGSALTLFFGPFPSSRACRSWHITTGFSKFILYSAGGAFRGEMPLQCGRRR